MLRPSRPLFTLLAFVTGAVTASAFACSEADSDDPGGSGGTGNQAPTSVGGSSDGGSPGTGGMGGDIFQNVGGSGTGGMESCLESEAEAEEKKLNILVVLDRSSSMGVKWDQSVTALSDFFNDPVSGGIAVALNFFPQDGVPDTCNPNHYNPPDLPFGDLPSYAPTLDAEMQTQDATGDVTPMYGALYGSYQYANLYQDTVPDEFVIVVFASDGVPNSCPGNQNDATVVAALADAALAYNGVRTFVVAIQGADIAVLDQIAAAGGTTQAFDGTLDTTLFKQKMEEIRTQVLACEFDIPDPTMGNFDPTKVNVQYTPGGTGTPEDLPQADDLDDCGSGPGWYYDDPANPQKIFLCPASCDVVQADPDAKVSFIFGCPTIVN